MPHKGKPMQETSKQNRIWQKSRETKTGLDFDVRQTPNCQMHRAHVQGHALVAPARPSCRREVCQIGKRAQRMFDRHETHHRLAFCHTPSTKIEPREFLLWHLLNRLLRPCEICCIPITEKILYNQCRNIPIRVKLPWPAVVLDFFLIRGGSAIANFLSCQVSFGESYCYLLWPHIQEGHQSAVTICTAAKTLNLKGVVEMWAPAVKFGSDKVCVCVCVRRAWVEGGGCVNTRCSQLSARYDSAVIWGVIDCAGSGGVQRRSAVSVAVWVSDRHKIGWWNIIRKPFVMWAQPGSLWGVVSLEWSHPSPQLHVGWSHDQLLRRDRHFPNVPVDEIQTLSQSTPIRTAHPEWRLHLIFHSKWTVSSLSWCHHLARACPIMKD